MRSIYQKQKRAERKRLRRAEHRRQYHKRRTSPDRGKYWTRWTYIPPLF